MLEQYGHGGDLESAAVAYDRAADTFLDFSANINPLGPPSEVMHMIEQALPSIIRYPDPGHRRLKELLASKLNVAEAEILIGNGAAECMALILLGLKPQKVGIVEPCFSEYRQLSEQYGAEVHSVQGTRENLWRASVADISALLREVDLLFIGQPNNPNGVQYNVDDLRELAYIAEQQGAFLVVDEAFIDFIPQESRMTLLPELQQYPHTILIRSMTKFYAIPGLRLGFAIAAPKLIHAMKSKQVTWSVNALALLAGEACLMSGVKYELETISIISEQRSYLCAQLAHLGCDVIQGEANFILVGLPTSWTAAAIQRELGVRGILIRSCAMYPGLGPEHIRLAVKDEKANRQLLNQLEEVLNVEDGLK
ncbi:threonine-phosphate decarboxylase CobD [Paenibacillus pini]|uniref:threonine-phosphate decarboxylase CobD n=1 Tax=Paenibacillus pini TaxID=669461 RepID=UPI00055FFAE7|nr:threonine-phosphate decarboxylase CobD [Paenibacillus pini]